MERRDRSLKALAELKYIDSLDSYEKADSLVSWGETYLKDKGIEKFDLELVDLKALEELFFKNINFLYKQKDMAKEDLINMRKMGQFLKN